MRTLLQRSLLSKEWHLISVSLARIIAATPHSCDVERLISSYNKVKTIDRSSLSPEIIADYLHVMFNMPDLAEFNVWPTVDFWLCDKERRQIKEMPKKESEWFIGIFPEARAAKETSTTARRVAF